MFEKYFNEKNILCVYYAFQIDLSESRFSNKFCNSSKPVWFIFSFLANDGCKSSFASWYKNHLGNMKEGFLCWLFPLLHYLGIISDGEPVEIPTDFKWNWDENREFKELVIDDYVIDIHTKQGRKKGVVEFAIVGSHVENPFEFVNNTWKRFYEDTKRFEENMEIIGENGNDNLQREITDYEFIVRTQLSTGNHKMDVYFAKDNTGKLVIVKGPYANQTEIEILERNTKWKKINGLPYIPYKIVKMIPDRWSEGVPLGARNTIDRSKPAWFIIFDSLIEEDEIKTKIHSSKVWPETEVVDWNKMAQFHFKYKMGNRTEQELNDYVSALLFRYIRGISDLADRNFLLYNGRVISIDEDIEGKNVNIYTELRKNKADYIYNWLNKNYNKLLIQKWKNIDEASSEERTRMDVVKNRDATLDLFKK
jgi:hypothetical protein